MTTKFWIEKGWGASVDNATIRDIDLAIRQIINKDDEHGVFWAGNTENDFVLEVQKGLKVFFIFGEELANQIVKELLSWEEVKAIYVLFFNGDYDKVKTTLKSKA